MAIETSDFSTDNEDNRGYDPGNVQGENLSIPPDVQEFVVLDDGLEVNGILDGNYSCIGIYYYSLFCLILCNYVSYIFFFKMGWMDVTLTPLQELEETEYRPGKFSSSVSYIFNYLINALFIHYYQFSKHSKKDIK